MQPLTIEKLNRIYEEAESADREVFAEMRSNVLLVAGEHYSRKGQRQVQQRLASRTDLTESQKLRLTKNHTHKVSRRYKANIAAHAPWVTPVPQRDDEIQDTKAAELNKSVWEDMRHRYKLDEKKRAWLGDYVDIGEVCVKIFWDPSAGDLIGYEQQVADDGAPLFNPDGSPMKGEPLFSGGLVFERVFGMNLLRHVGSNAMIDAECWIVRKMVDVETLQEKYKDDPAKLKLINDSSKEDYVVFDADKANYRRDSGKCLLREFYWPVSRVYPEGYFVFATTDGVLEEGPLPFGVFPLCWKGFDQFATTCRGRSIIKVVRPYQAEINRAASACAMQQVTLGDDKVLYQAGSKLSQGSLLPGVRGIAYAGLPPTVLPGRDGSQYIGYIDKQIEDLYRAVDMDEELEEKQAQVDPHSLLFRSLNQKKKYGEYGEKFEEFLVEICQTALTLARYYYDDQMYIVATGAEEQVNIAEFRRTSPLSYRIAIEPREETLETQFGKQLTFNHILQYVGPNLDKEDIGPLIAAMPFLNQSEAFEDLTLDRDCLHNDMLQMERGVMPPFGKYDNDEYFIRKLTARTRKGDFRFLSPRVQQIYNARIAMHERAKVEKLRADQALKSEFIPTNGAMIATDMYVPNPAGPDKPAKRVRIPYQALDWLVKTLESQGQSLDQLETQNGQVISEMAGMLANGRARTPLPPMTTPNAMGGSAFSNGQSALGVS